MSFASYIPSYVRRGRLPKAAIAATGFSGAVLFADISGFTPLASALAKRGAAGTEELSRALNAYFDRLLSIVAEHGGDPIKFAGDAVLTIWPAAPTAGGMAAATLAAAQCGRSLQDILSRLRSGSNDLPVPAGLHCCGTDASAAGRCRRLVACDDRGRAGRRACRDRKARPTWGGRGQRPCVGATFMTAARRRAR